MQVLKELDLPYQFYSADNVPASNTAWVSNCWDAVRGLKRINGWESVILVIDEIQNNIELERGCEKGMGRGHIQ